MLWRQPSAWFGLAALAVPLLVHLLGRRRPTPLRFPSLRFLDVSKIVPARRHRLNDVPLLIVRMAIITAAVAALAGPVFVGMRSVSAGTLARAVVVDTSASMNRLGADGRTAAMAARERAQALTNDASASRVIDGAALGAAVAAAAGWLAGTSGTRELVVISDFQTGIVRTGRPGAARPGDRRDAGPHRKHGADRRAGPGERCRRTGVALASDRRRQGNARHVDASAGGNRRGVTAHDVRGAW